MHGITKHSLDFGKWFNNLSYKLEDGMKSTSTRNTYLHLHALNATFLK